MHTIVFAYSQENEYQIQSLAQQLNVDGLEINHLTCDKISDDQNLAKLLGQQKHPTFLFISDNFLKSKACMEEGLQVIHQIQDNNNIHPIIIDGIETDSTGSSKFIPTQFDRVSNVIQYMNFWQEKYLEVRKMKRNATPENEEAVNQQVNIVRAISTEVGEFLRLLRATEFLTFEQLSSEQFAAFFHLGQIPHHLQERFLETTSKNIQTDPEVVVKEEVVTTNSFETNSSTINTPPPSVEKVSVLETSQVVQGFSSAKDVPTVPDSELLNSLFDEEDEEEDGSEFIGNTDESLNLEAEEIEIDLSSSPPPSHSSSEDLLHQARQLLNDGQTDQAFSLYEQLLTREPSNINARYHFASALASQGKNIPKAMEHLEFIVKQDPMQIHALRKLAEHAESLNDFLLAKEYYEKIINIDPSAEGVPYKLGVINLNFFSEQPKVAATYFKAAIKQNKKHVDAHYQYAIIMSEYLGKYDKAVRHFNKTLDLNPRHTFANYDLALLYHKIGNHRLAAKYYKRAYAVNPELKTAENDAAFFFPFPEAESDSLDVLGRDTIAPPQESAIRLSDVVETDTSEKKIEKIVPPSRKAVTTPSTVKLTTLKGPQEGKVVWITGATSGIGKACAKVFNENGYSLVITGRRIDRLDILKKELESLNGFEVQTLNFDVRDRQAVKTSIEQLPEAWRTCDLLINNAGLASGYGPIHEGNIDDWEVMIDTNVKGLLYMTRLISPGMVQRRRGHIINIASTAGKEVYPNGNVYCATKFAVDALTKAMRLDLHKFGIKVSQIAPGHVEETEFAEVRFHGDKERAKIYEDFHPLTAKDVAETLYFVATRPAHVNIQDVLMMGTQQASSNFIDRSGRK